MIATVLASLAIGVQSFDALSPLEVRAGYKSIFDGKSFEGWTGWKKTSIPKNWVIADGTIACLGGDDHGDIRTNEMYGDFDLILEWKIESGGNSGIFYRATEDLATPWQSGPEFQVLDDEKAPDGKSPLTSAASCYALYAPAGSMTRPAGMWNEARIVAKGPRIEHWLNGVRVVAYELGSSDWLARWSKSKFKRYPDFGKKPRGHFVLQDHWSKVWYRNIRVRSM